MWKIRMKMGQTRNPPLSCYPLVFCFVESVLYLCSRSKLERFAEHFSLGKKRFKSFCSFLRIDGLRVLFHSRSDGIAFTGKDFLRDDVAL